MDLFLIFCCVFFSFFFSVLVFSLCLRLIFGGLAHLLVAVFVAVLFASLPLKWVFTLPLSRR